MRDILDRIGQRVIGVPSDWTDDYAVVIEVRDYGSNDVFSDGRTFAEARVKLDAWCLEQCCSQWRSTTPGDIALRYHFGSEAEAAMFKLTFGGTTVRLGQRPRDKAKPA